MQLSLFEQTCKVDNSHFSNALLSVFRYADCWFSHIALLSQRELFDAIVSFHSLRELMNHFLARVRIVKNYITKTTSLCPCVLVVVVLLIDRDRVIYLCRIFQIPRSNQRPKIKNTRKKENKIIALVT